MDVVGGLVCLEIKGGEGRKVGRAAGSLGIFTASSNPSLPPLLNFSLDRQPPRSTLTTPSIDSAHSSCPRTSTLLPKMTVIPALALPSSPTSSVLPSFSRSPHSHTIPPPNPSNSSSKLSSPPSPPSPSTEEPLVHIQNCRIASDSGVSQPSSIWFDPVSGKIVGAQEAFYAAQERGREVREVDMGGDVVAPG